MLKCDICVYLCGKSAEKADVAVVDGRTVHGPWANMCAAHFASYGVGLGMGYGQLIAGESKSADEAQ